MSRVDFFIAGVQKAGTTALDAFLRGHPQIQMAKTKETHFFDDERAIDWSRPDYGRLHDQFDWSYADLVRGEATPIYSYWPHALERLRKYNPDAKLIILLRHPSFRAYSQWKMETKRGNDLLAFSDAIRPSGRQRVIDAPGGVHRIFSYVERGFYADQISRLLKLFPRENLLFFRTDYLWSNTKTALNRVEQFLGIAPRAQHQTTYVVSEQTWSTVSMFGDDRLYLDTLFGDGIRRTAGLTGLELGDWLQPEYDEPMRPNESP